MRRSAKRSQNAADLLAASSLGLAILGVTGHLSGEEFGTVRLGFVNFA
ncbi:hypothetical protein [Natrinema caseinilyticum]|nr:hypothetical protein [Natrinema caseinilyticum]